MDTNQKWVLEDGAVEVETRFMSAPFTLSLTSHAANRKLQFTMNGTDWSDVVLDTDGTNEIIVAILSPVLGVKATGDDGDVMRMVRMGS